MIDGGLVGLELRCDAEYKSGEAGVSLSLSLSVFFFLCVCAPVENSVVAEEII